MQIFVNSEIDLSKINFDQISIFDISFLCSGTQPENCNDFLSHYATHFVKIFHRGITPQNWVQEDKGSESSQEGPRLGKTGLNLKMRSIFIMLHDKFLSQRHTTKLGPGE